MQHFDSPIRNKAAAFKFRVHVIRLREVNGSLMESNGVDIKGSCALQCLTTKGCASFAYNMFAADSKDILCSMYVRCCACCDCMRVVHLYPAHATHAMLTAHARCTSRPTMLHAPGEHSSQPLSA